MSSEQSQPRHTLRRALLVLGGIALLVFGGYALFLFIPFSCANDHQVESVSPNGQLKAVTYRRNCGATTSYSTHVSIIAASAKLPNEGGNIFVARDEPPITVHWLDDDSLSISGGEAATVFLRVTDFFDVHITYN